MSFYQMLALLSITTAGPRMLSVLLYERMTLPDWTKRWRKVFHMQSLVL